MFRRQKSQDAIQKRNNTLTSINLIQMRGLVDPDKQLGFRKSQRPNSRSIQRHGKSVNQLKQKFKSKQLKEDFVDTKKEFFTPKNQEVYEQYGYEIKKQLKKSSIEIESSAKKSMRTQKKSQKSRNTLYQVQSIMSMLKIKFIETLQSLGMEHGRIDRLQIFNLDQLMYQFIKEIKKNIKFYQKLKQQLQKNLKQNLSLKRHISEIKNHQTTLYEKIQQLQSKISNYQKKSNNLEISRKNSFINDHGLMKMMQQLNQDEHENDFESFGQIYQKINIQMQLQSFYSYLQNSKSMMLKNGDYQVQKQTRVENSNQFTMIKEDDIINLTKHDFASFVSSLKMEMRMEQATKRKIYLKNFANQWKKYTNKLIANYQKQLQYKNKLQSHFYKGQQKK